MNIAEAKAKLAELVRRAEAGEEVIIARDGVPVVRMSAANSNERKVRRLGLWAHLGPLSEADEKALEEPLYTDPELEDMEKDWPLPRGHGQ